jgi:hypothetical protein
VLSIGLLCCTLPENPPILFAATEESAVDPAAFDRLSHTVATAGTRRGLLRLLAALPVAGGMFSLQAPVMEGQGNGAIVGGGGGKRRKRRKRRHDPGDDRDNRKGKGKGKKRKGKKTPTHLCQGVSCPPPADTCHLQGSCDPATGLCSNPDKCPSGQVCLSNGTCATDCGSTPGICVNFTPGCGCAQDSGADSYCALNLGPQGDCTTNANCPMGQFCFQLIGQCFFACNDPTP